MQKICNRCKVSKVLLDFYQDKYKKDGCENICKDCRNGYRRKNRGHHNRYQHTDEQFINAVKQACSYRQVMILLGIVPEGGNYRIVKNRIKKLNLDVSSFKHQGWNKGLKPGPKRPIEDYLSNKRDIQSCKLKNRLIKEGFFEARCYNCNLTKWLDNPIPTELHHKDGDSSNNKLENLTILCPNCHTLTDNYRGKNK